MAKLKSVRQYSDIHGVGKLAFFHYLERVETMRCFWEMKHIELEGDFPEVGITLLHLTLSLSSFSLKQNI